LIFMFKIKKLILHINLNIFINFINDRIYYKNFILNFQFKKFEFKFLILKK